MGLSHIVNPHRVAGLALKTVRSNGGEYSSREPKRTDSLCKSLAFILRQSSVIVMLNGETPTSRMIGLFDHSCPDILLTGL